MIKLYFYPATNQLIDSLLEDFCYQWDARTGAFIFEEEEDLVDNLELSLQKIFDLNNISGYFEAV